MKGREMTKSLRLLKAERKQLEGEWNDYLDDVVDDLFNLAFDKDWSWFELSRQSKVSYTTICRLGNRDTLYPRLSTVWKIAKAVGANIEIQVSHPVLKRKAG